MSLARVRVQEGAMARLLGYTSRDSEDGPKEIVRSPSASGDSGWLIRFFDSAFFCEWIAVSYLYKHEHSGVRDYLCNRMYTLPLPGIESYLFQLCYMLVHMPSPSLERYIIDLCAKSLRIAIKIHWFLIAEAEDVDDSTEIIKLQEKCQESAIGGEWPPLIRPQKSGISSGAKNRVFKAVLSSRRLLPITSSPPSQRIPPSLPVPAAADEGFREAGRTPGEETESSLKSLKKFIPTSTSKVRNAFLKPFRDKEEKEEKDDDEVIITERPVKEIELDSVYKRPVKEIESDSFFKRLFKDKDDDEKAVRSEELINSEGFFRRLFREKADGDEKVDDEKDGFFRMMMRRKPDDEEKGTGTWEEEETSEFFAFLKRFRQVHPEVEKMAEALSGQEHPTSSIGAETSPVNENFFKRFKEEGTKLFSMRRDGDPSVVPSTTPSGFLKRLFKDRNDEEATALADEIGSLSVSADSTDGSNEGNFLQESLRGMNLFRGKVRSHDLETVGKDPSISRPLETSAAEQRGTDAHTGDGSDMSRCEPATVAEKTLTNSTGWKLPSSDSSFFDMGRSFIKRPSSPKQKTEKVSAKPPLPKYSAVNMRKGVCLATLDFVQSLCETSSGLVEIFPMEDRMQALRESVMELNQHLEAAENDGGVCFPMGKGLYRVVHIPADECVLLNSREKAPYMIFLEVLRCETKSSETKDQRQSSTGSKTAKGGIPLANGDAQLQRPPPWAYPLQPDIQQPNTQQLLRSASKAIDLAMTHLWETKLKVVDVSFSVQARKERSSDLQVSRVCSVTETEQSAQHLGTHSRDCNENACRCIDSELGHCRDLPSGTIDQSDLQKNHERSRDVDNIEGEEWVRVLLSVVPGVKMEDIEEEQPARRKDHRRVPSTIAMAEVKAAVAEGEAPAGVPAKKSGTGPSVTQTEGGVSLALQERIRVDGKTTDALAGELWENKKERIRKASKWSSNPDWDLRSVIVKSGDDCRQEHLAVQLVGHFYDIFQEAGLPLWLRPYEVLVTSSHTALIETIYDTASIHAIKSRNSNLASLRDFFCKKYKEGSPSFKLAQRNFVESMAGYSILCYILQVKDRHNSNLLIDEDGHIIHIDFGFMLSNSPGGVNFESAPFKLTRELLEVMDSDAEGTASEFFDYFKVLCIQGFLTCRKHAERIILLVEMMQDSGCPCFKGGPRTMQNLRKRFHLSLTEEQCVSSVLSLISSSLDAWRTRQYDYYQRVLNGIL